MAYRHSEGAPEPTRLMIVSKTTSNGWAFPLAPEKPVIVVGCGLGIDIRVEGTSVAPAHAEIHRTAYGLEVRDLGSPSGTLLDGQRITIAPLRIGAMLQIGSVTLSVCGEVDPANVVREDQAIKHRLFTLEDAIDVDQFRAGIAATKSECVFLVRSGVTFLEFRCAHGIVQSVTVQSEDVSIEGAFAVFERLPFGTRSIHLTAVPVDWARYLEGSKTSGTVTRPAPGVRVRRL